MWGSKYSSEYNNATNAASNFNKKIKEKKVKTKEEEKQKKMDDLISKENVKPYDDCLKRIKENSEKGKYSCTCLDINEGYEMKLKKEGFKVSSITSYYTTSDAKKVAW